MTVHPDIIALQALIVVRPEQPDLRETTARPARVIACIGIRADAPCDVVPIGTVTHAASITGLVAATFGPAFAAIDPAPFGCGTLHVGISCLGVGVIG